MTGTEYVDHLSNHVLWDVDRRNVDPRAHRRFLIARVMDRGTDADVEATRAFFSPEEIREALLNARGLSKKTVAYFSAVLDEPRERFRSYETAFKGTWP